MADPDALVCALWAVAPMYLAVRHATWHAVRHVSRRTARGPRRGPSPRPISWPVIALVFLGSAAWLSTRAGLATAVVTALAAWTAVASAMVLLVPARPRLARLLAVLAPCVAALVTLAGGCHGT